MRIYSLKDFYLGNNDGKKEAQYREDFEQFFYDYNNIYEKVMSKEKYLILGRKGTGKTILAEFMHKKATNSPNVFCSISSYKEFKFYELLLLKNDDIAPNEYISIWEWVILIELSRMCAKDEGIANNHDKEILVKFISDNFYSLEITSNKVIEITKNNELKGSLGKGALSISGGGGKSTTYQRGSYLNYLADLKERVVSVLETSTSEYILIYDELDDKFRDEPKYRDCIISLIKATDSLNLEFIRRKIGAKVMLLLRSDIYSVLNDPDLNKIKMDNSITIDWGRSARKDSPLLDLIFLKIKRSTELLRSYKREELFDILFPSPINGIPPEQFLLERSFFRPRDIITYLNMIIDRFPDKPYFPPEGFLDAQRDYSEYFFQEVRNELSGHMSDEKIDESTILLKQFNKYHFRFAEIQIYFEKNKSLFPSVELRDDLSMLFKFSVIGNRWFPAGKSTYYYSWAFRDNNARIDFDKEFVVHLGLRKELSM